MRSASVCGTAHEVPDAPRLVGACGHGVHHRVSAGHGRDGVSVSVRAELFGVHPRSDRDLWSHAWRVDGRAADRAVPSVASRRVRARPGPEHQFDSRKVAGYGCVGRNSRWARFSPRVLFRQRLRELRGRDHSADRRGSPRALPVDRETGEINARDAASAARDQKAPGEVQERPPEAQRRDDEVLQREPDQPARRVSAASPADAGFHRVVPNPPEDPELHSYRFGHVRGPVRKGNRSR